MRIQRQRETFAYRVADLEKPLKDRWQPGEPAHFEYHCSMSPESGDFYLWKRTQQPVTVIGVSPDGEDFTAEMPTVEERMDEGVPLTYAVKFQDGTEGTVMEDELLTHPKFYTPRVSFRPENAEPWSQIFQGERYLHPEYVPEELGPEWVDYHNQTFPDLEKKKTASGFAYRLANDLVEEYTEQLSKEFHDWIDSQEGPEGRRGVWPVGGPEVPPGGTAPPADYTQPMGGPLTWWDNIEAFVKERYPAAYRGYRYGEENAAQALDGGRMRMPTQYSLYPDRTVHPPYETGPEAVEKYGYDPRQVAAGFMYLHTNAHMTARPDSRVPLLSRDIDRLSEIFQKRQHMQRVYEQNKEREKLAVYRLATLHKLASGYSTVHEKVRKDKGAPSGHSCVDCGSKADHWTYDHSSDSEKTKTNDSLPYSTDTKHYSPRCRSCHNKLDKKAAKTPKGVTFELSRTGYGNSQPVVYAIAENPEWSGGINVGELQWYHPNGDPPPGPDNEVNQIKWIKVDPEYQRQGIATAMYEWAKKNANPDLTFSPHMTDDGYAWSKSQGYAPSRWKRFDNRRGSEWVTA